MKHADIIARVTQRVLFVCSRNRLRSPTAERVFGEMPGVEADSAGLAPDADGQLSRDQLDWADTIFVMERAHRAKLMRTFGGALKGKRVICLDIPDSYTFMQPELVSVLERKVLQHLRHRS